MVDRLLEQTDTTTKRPSSVHLLLPDLGINTWITTNFDDLLERTLTTRQIPFCVGINNEDEPRLNSDLGAIKLVKIHGDRRAPGTMVFTKKDYYLASRQRAELWNWLRVELSQKTIVFLGYSHTDPDFSQLQADLLHVLGESYRKSYAFMFGIDSVCRDDLAARNVEVIDLRRGDDHDRTATLSELIHLLIGKGQGRAFACKRYERPDAARDLPSDVLKTFQQRKLVVSTRIEYHVHCDLTDSAQPNTGPVNCSPILQLPLPTELLDERWVCEFYERSDDPQRNIWRGWAIADRRECSY